MLDASVFFLIGLTATTVGSAGLCFFAYDAARTRGRLHRRVDLLPPVQPSAKRPERHGGASATLAPRLLTSAFKGAQFELARGLEALHLRADRAPRVFLLLQLAGAAIAGSGLAMLGYHYTDVIGIPIAVGLALAGGGLGWRMPHLVGGRLALRRQRAIARGLPDAIELMVIAVEAGLPLEDAVSRITGELRGSQPAMAEELAATSADLRILPSREDALRRLVERVDLPAMHSVVTTLSQTLRYGTPLAQALRVVAAELRNDMLARLEEQTNRLPVLLTVPMILFILPSVFLIIMGPASLSILDAFTR
jgi:tight adherence protein C